jgi:hypothetical protein
VAATLVTAILLRHSIAPEPIRIDALTFGDQAITISSETDSMRLFPEGGGDNTTWCLTQLRDLKLPPESLPAWPGTAVIAVGRGVIAGQPVAVFRYRDERGECDILAVPQSTFQFENLREGPQLIHFTRNLVVIAWQESRTTYFAVLKGWSPEHWKPLVGRDAGLT